MNLFNLILFTYEVAGMKVDIYLHIHKIQKKNSLSNTQYKVQSLAIKCNLDSASTIRLILFKLGVSNGAMGENKI